ncbi:hypothetical protein Tco_0218294 [Tanacetum coccineum]
MPKSIHLDHHDTAHYIPMYHQTGGFTGHEREAYKSLVSRLFHEDRVIESTVLDDQPNLRPTFVAIGFDCLLDINKKICPIFVLQFYKSVHLIQDSSLIRDALFYERTQAKTRKMKGVETILNPFQIIVFELKNEFKKWEIILSENVKILTGNKDHPNACLCYILYCFAIENPFNLAYYIANRMVSVTKSADMTLPYGMLLTRLFEHVCANHPNTFSNELYLVDHVMIPLFEKRVYRFKDKGKRPCLPTLTPHDTELSDLPSPTPHQGVENDPVENYTLDPIPYMNQLLPIKEGDSPKFKQTKGMFKCIFHFLSKKK